MDWMIKLTGILITVALTGSAAFLVWYLWSPILRRWGYGRWRRTGLWAVALLYMLPVVYMGMLWDVEQGRWGGILFLPTLTILNAARWILLIWGIGAGVLACRLIVSLIAQYKSCQKQIPCELEVQELFGGICRELGIKPGTVALVRDYSAKVPGFMGILHPRVVLPVQEFTQEQLRVILLHELTHYKQGDMYLLMFSALLQTVQWFHPFIWLFGREARRCSEYACDEKVCGKAGGRKRYFDIIFEVMCTSDVQKSAFSMHMMEDKNELVRRKKYMKDVETGKKKPAVCLALSVMLVMGCSATVLAAADGMGDQYQKWYRETVIETEEPYEPIVYEEFTDHGPAENIKVETGETNQVTRSMTTISWSVGSNTLKKSSGVSAKKGQTITISVTVDPDTKSVKVGIIDSSGNRRYVTGKGTISYDFEIKSTDTYKIFVENTNSSSVEVEGYYSVK